MKILTDREKLFEALGVINSVIPTKSTKPILANVCLVATEEALELVGTDLEVAARYRVEDVKVSETGTTVIPARIAQDFVRDLSGETVEIAASNGNCVLSSDPDSCELLTADAEEFPVVARFDDSQALSVQAGSLARLVNRTSFAAAREAGRYAMNGTLVEVENDRLKLVATDGRRLALTSMPVDVPKHLNKSWKTIVPIKGMQLFCRVLSDPLDQVAICFEENQIGLRTKNAEVFARLLDGEFPRYEGVVPTQLNQVMEAEPEMLGRKIRLVANVAGDDARAVRLSLSKGQLELTGRSSARGEAKAQMTVVYTGPKSSISFNPEYVIEGLKKSEKDVVQLEFQDSSSPGKFVLGEDYIYIVMPITMDA